MPFLCRLVAAIGFWLGLCRGQCIDIGVAAGIAVNDFIPELFFPDPLKYTAASDQFLSPGQSLGIPGAIPAFSASAPPREAFYICLWAIEAPTGYVVDATVVKDAMFNGQCGTRCSLSFIDGIGVFGGTYKDSTDFTGTADVHFTSSTNYLAVAFFGYAPIDTEMGGAGNLAFAVTYTTRQVALSQADMMITSEDQVMAVTAVASMGAFAMMTMLIVGGFG